MAAAFGGCCCGCVDGAVVDRRQNVTKVRATDETSATYDCAPFMRYDRTDYELENGPDACSALTGCSACGNWLYGDGSNALPVQDVQDMVKDIMACGGGATVSDHNCYSINGTLDMRQTQRKGGQWILAARSHHGRLPFLSANANNDDCAGVIPLQTRYRKIKRKVEMKLTGYNGTGGCLSGYAWPDATDACTGATTGIVWETQIAWAKNIAATFEVDPRSGVITSSDVERQPATKSGTYYAQNIIWGAGAVRPWSESGTLTLDDNFNYPDPLGTNWNRKMKVCPDDPLYPLELDATLPAYGNQAIDVKSLFEDVWAATLLGMDSVCGQLVTDGPGLNGWFTYNTWAELMAYIPTQTVQPNPNGGYFYAELVSQTCSDTKMEFEVVSKGKTSPPTTGEGFYIDFKATFKLTIELSEPYTTAELYQDWLELFKSWDMSDFSLAHLREDEKLASAPLIVRDGKNGIISPDVKVFAGVPDYYAGRGKDSAGRNPGDPGYVPTQALRDWFDPDAFRWVYANGSINTPDPDSDGIITGATLHGPNYTGEIISHSPPGSDRHFWFGFYSMVRRPDDCGSGASDFFWAHDGMGGLTPSEIPAAAMRWMDRLAAQYDAGPFCDPDSLPHAGNYPQAFINQGGGSIIGGKYVEAAFPWKSVNYGRPCGPDRYAVDQTTVCTIVGYDAGAFTVRTTAGALAPLAGGIAVGNYIAVAMASYDGLYEVSNVVSTSPDVNGNAQWLVYVVGGAMGKIEELPTGWQMAERDDSVVPGADYMGKLRWVNYTRNSTTVSMPSPICGRAACTTSFNGALVTVTFTAAQPWLRKDVTTGKIVIDLWNAAHTTKVAAAVELTRVSDTEFTYAAGANPNAAWATGKNYVWTDYDETPKHTGIRMSYSFDNRSAQADWAGSVPAWFDGVVGCTSCDKEEFTYAVDKCRAMVGHVPFYTPLIGGELIGSGLIPAPEPVEDFKNQVLFDFPGAFSFDDRCGAHWQAEVDMVMPDPFWQAPFTPDGGIDRAAGDTMSLIEDDGTGHTSYVNEGEFNSDYYVYYPHRRWVEAAKDIPAGKSLPAGLSLFYANDIAPTHWLLTQNPSGNGSFTGGLRIGDTEGNYASVETAYGFRARACANIAVMGNFYEYYQEFVPC